MQNSVIVVGAGVVGLSAAIAAQARGMRVTVIDREGPAAGASAGNAGAFAFTDIFPLASPRIFLKAPRWLMDPLGPLSLPPAYALRILPWLLRFTRACAPDRVAASVAAQTAIMDLSKAVLEGFLTATGTLPMLRKNGNLEVYEGEAQFRKSLPGWEARARHGIAFRHLTAAEMPEVQPGLAPRFTHGTFTPGWYSIADPKLYTLALADHFRARGGVIERGEVIALRPSDSGVEVLADRPFRADKVVIAAGAFSHRIARTIGEKIPLETERGYNTTLPPDAFDLRCQVTFGGHGFVVSSLSTGLRVGGAVELGGLNLPPNFRRSEAMLRKAAAFLPGLRTTGGVQWMGFRPSLPDSLPALGPSRVSRNVIHAFGHGHLGLTQSVGTARIVADLLAGVRPPIDITPFSPQRF
ncbi:NAD(P)/FAD-dependent oxidoreductase [Paenirhodobacter populi]|uniref:FAD-binding oxidoreductase n=1 Tax=Paenirhodobacter populi TaxID=2306993 RepID=A0A443JDH0_9RHOB|nr:FAD-binding oxidoreductase [Sinirhodobacter populi]RWR18480.1 FAD-binding oxidoreductase [Sinirhodobacter populi]